MGNHTETGHPVPAARHLGDLTAAGRLAALFVVVLLAVPYVAAVVRAADVGWRPSNDDALIALRVHDVLDREWPQLGQPSTAEHYTDSEILRHPGPIQFYLFAPLVALVGADQGLPIGAAAVNLGAVLMAAWVMLRRAGPKVALAAAPALALLAWAQGPVQLVDPISSNMGGIPLIAVGLLVWAVVDGDFRLLPLLALVLAFVAQQHLAVFGLSVGLAVFGVVSVVVSMIRGRDQPSHRDALPWVVGALAVSLVAWAPVLVDQVAGTGNLGRFLTFAGESDRPGLGWWSGLRQAARAIGVPPLVWRTDLTGDDLHAALSPLSWLSAALVVAALASIAVVDRHTRPARARLAATVLVLLVLGVITGSNVPDSVEAGRLNLYRWAFVASVLAWLVLAWKGASVVASRRSELREGDRRRGIVIVWAVVLVGVTGAAVSASGPKAWRDQVVFEAESDMADAVLAVLAEFDGGARVLLVPVGRAAEFSVAPAIALDLVEAGHRIGVPPSQESGYGMQLVANGDYDAALVVVSGTGVAQEWPGSVVARVDLNAASASARARLAEQVRGRDLVVSATADEVLVDLVGRSDGDTAAIFATYMESLADDPESVLLHPLVGRALAAGYFEGIELDADAVQTLVEHPPVEVWNDDVIEVRLLTPDQITQHRDALMAVGIGRPVQN